MKVYLLHLVHFNQAYCTLVMWYCHTTGASRIRFQKRNITAVL